MKRQSEYVQLVHSLEAAIMACCADMMPAKVHLQAIAEGCSVCLAALVSHAESFSDAMSYQSIHSAAVREFGAGPMADTAAVVAFDKAQRRPKPDAAAKVGGEGGVVSTVCCLGALFAAGGLAGVCE